MQPLPSGEDGGSGGKEAPNEGPRPKGLPKGGETFGCLAPVRGETPSGCSASQLYIFLEQFYLLFGQLEKFIDDPVDLLLVRLYLCSEADYFCLIAVDPIFPV